MQAKVGDAKAKAAGAAAAKQEEDTEMEALEEAMEERRKQEAAQAAVKASKPSGEAEPGTSQEQNSKRPRCVIFLWFGQDHFQ